MPFSGIFGRVSVISYLWTSYRSHTMTQEPIFWNHDLKDYIPDIFFLPFFKILIFDSVSALFLVFFGFFFGYFLSVDKLHILWPRKCIFLKMWSLRLHVHAYQGPLLLVFRILYFWPFYGFFCVYCWAFFGVCLSMNELQVTHFDPENYHFEKKRSLGLYQEIYIDFDLIWGWMTYRNLGQETFVPVAVLHSQLGVVLVSFFNGSFMFLWLKRK